MVYVSNCDDSMYYKVTAFLTVESEEITDDS